MNRPDHRDFDRLSKVVCAADGEESLEAVIGLDMDSVYYMARERLLRAMEIDNGRVDDIVLMSMWMDGLAAGLNFERDRELLGGMD